MKYAIRVPEREVVGSSMASKVENNMGTTAHSKAYPTFTLKVGSFIEFRQ